MTDDSNQQPAQSSAGASDNQPIEYKSLPDYESAHKLRKSKQVRIKKATQSGIYIRLTKGLFKKLFGRSDKDDDDAS